MKITITPVKVSELQPGDLFSHFDEGWWKEFISDHEAVGHRLYVRTDNTCVSPDYDPDQIIYRVTIKK